MYDGPIKRLNEDGFSAAHHLAAAETFQWLFKLPGEREGERRHGSKKLVVFGRS